MTIKRSKLFFSIVVASAFVCNAQDPAPAKQQPGNAQLSNESIVLSGNINASLLELIIGKQSDKSYSGRIKAIHKLDKRLSREEIDNIYQFLNKPISEDVLKPLEFNSLKNELVIVLMRQNGKPGSLSTKLVEMYQNKKLDSVWRDYCIQFMGQWYKDASPKDQKLLIMAMTDALKETSNGIAGTSLIAMNSNADQPGIDAQKLGEAAFAVVTDKKNPDYVKLTALQICAMRQDPKALPVAREILRDSKNVPLKISAIAAIGMLGNNEDLDTIKKLSESTDVRIRIAADSARKKLMGKK